MQRRAAAAYVVFFVLIAAGSYAFIATAQSPTVTIDDPDYELQSGGEITVDGRTYTVSNLEAKESEGGGHGGGGGTEYSGELTWVNDSALYTETWEENETTLEDVRVEASAGSVTITAPDPSTANVSITGGQSANSTEVGSSQDTLVVTYDDGSTEEFTPVPGARITETSIEDNGSRVLVTYYPEDVTAYDVFVPDNSTVVLREQPSEETVERDGRTFVVVDTDGDGTEELVPIDEYEGIDRVEIDEDDELQYLGNATSTSFTRPTATITWRAPRTNAIGLNQASNVTLNGQTFLVYFESGQRAVLTDDYESYNQQVEEQDVFHERMNGFWGLVLLSGAAAILLTGLAFLPSKDT